MAERASRHELTIRREGTHAHGTRPFPFSRLARRATARRRRSHSPRFAGARSAPARAAPLARLAQHAATEHFVFHYPAEYREWTLALARRIEGVRAQVTQLVGFAPDAARARRGGRSGERGERLRVHHARRADDRALAHAARPARRRSATRACGRSCSPRTSTRTSPSSRARRAIAQAAAAGALAPCRSAPSRIKAPRWVLEGYATYVEGRVTGSGRPNNAWRAAMLRQFALEGRLPSYAAAQRDGGRMGSGQLRLPRRLGVSRMARAARGRLQRRRAVAPHDRGHRPLVRPGLRRRVRRARRRSCTVDSARSSPAKPSRSNARCRRDRASGGDARAATRSQHRRSRRLARRPVRRAHDPPHRCAQPAGRVAHGATSPTPPRRAAASAQRRARPRGRARSRLLSAAEEAGHHARRHRRRAVRVTALVQRRQASARVARSPRARRHAAARPLRLERGGRRPAARSRTVRRCATPTRPPTGAGPRPCGATTAGATSCAWISATGAVRVLRPGSVDRNYYRPRVSRTTGEIVVAEQSARPLAHRARVAGDRRAAVRRPRRRCRRATTPPSRRDGRDASSPPPRPAASPISSGSTARRARAAHTRSPARPWLPDVAPDGAMWFLSLHGTGYDLRRLPRDSGRARLRGAGDALASPTRSPPCCRRACVRARRRLLAASRAGGVSRRARLRHRTRRACATSPARPRIRRHHRPARARAQRSGGPARHHAAWASVGSAALPEGGALTVTSRAVAPSCPSRGGSRTRRPRASCRARPDEGLDLSRCGGALRVDRTRVGDGNAISPASLALLAERQRATAFDIATRERGDRGGAASRCASATRRCAIRRSCRVLGEVGRTREGAYVRQRGALRVGVGRGTRAAHHAADRVRQRSAAASGEVASASSSAASPRRSSIPCSTRGASTRRRIHSAAPPAPPSARTAWPCRSRRSSCSTPA